jgi:hypothetical protein
LRSSSFGSRLWSLFLFFLVLLFTFLVILFLFFNLLSTFPIISLYAT